MSNIVKTISFDIWHQAPELFANQLGENQKLTGFCGIKDHPIQKDLVNDCIDMFADFFHLNNKIKMQYFDEKMGGARGYTPYKIETPKDGNHADLKEFWQMGRDLPLEHMYKKYMFDNYFASEITEFEIKIKELFSSFDQFGQQLMQAIALYLKLDIDHFEDSINYGNSVLRAIHYPPIATEEPGERAGAHGDINLITLLIGGHKPGLEILFENKWIPINTEHDTLVCNIGDMLERYTNHLLPSVIHRVTSHSDQTKGSSRYSIPFFLHPNPDWLIKTLPSCIDNDHPDLYPESIIADDFLQKRLHEINLL